jgi:glycosyltransferase involved in cell wall biosynthesis
VGSPGGVIMVTSHYPPAVGGTERQAHHLAAGLVGKGYRVTVLTLARADVPAHEVLDGVRVERTLTAAGRGPIFAATYGLSLLRHLRRLRPGHALLHAQHLYLEAMAAVWVGCRVGLPTLAKVAGGGSGGDCARLRRTGLRVGLPLLRRLQCVVATTAEIETQLLANGFAPARIVRIPNGVDPIRFAPAPDPAAARAQAGCPAETVLYLGRLDPGKGLDVALAAWQRVSARRPRARLALAGDGPGRRALEARCAALDLGDSVRFLGVRPDPEVLLRGAQVFVLPSRSEGMSNALLEAMATGLACVATRIGGNCDLVQDGMTGLLTTVDDTAGLADALEALLDDAALRERLGAGARERVLQSFTMDGVVRRYAHLYAEMIGVRA